MIRLFLGLGWVRWRVLYNTIRGARKRDTGEEISRLLALIAPLILVVSFFPLTIGLAVGGWYAGWALGGDPETRQIAVIVLRFVFIVVTGAVLLGPLVRSTQGAELDPTRLALLPVSRRKLWLAHLAGALGEPWLLAVLPGLLVLPLGLAARGAPAAALGALAASLTMIAAFAALGALCGFFVVVLFRDRRRAERFTFWAMVAFILFAMSFSLLDVLIEDGMNAVEADEVWRQRIRNINGDLPWLRFLPSESFAFALRGAAAGDAGALLGNLGALAAAAGLLVWLGGVLHARTLEAPSGGGGSRGAGLHATRWPRLRGMPLHASAVAWVTVRSTLRTVRGKLAVYFNFVVVLLIAFGAQRELRLLDLEHDANYGPVFVVAGFALTLLSLQPILLNMFAVDRAGMTQLLTAPLSARDVMLGKLVGGGLLTGISVALCLAATVVVARAGGPLLWLAALVAVLGSYALFGATGCLVSVWLPKTSDLSRLGKAGNPHPAAAILGMLMTLLFAGPAGLVLLPALLADASDWLPLLLACSWTAIALVVTRALLRAAAAGFEKRRENLQLVAGGR